MARQELDHLLGQCLQEMEQTGDIEEVLRRHPEYAEELRPMLQLASTVREQYAEVPEAPAGLRAGLVRLRREARQARRAGAAGRVAPHRQERRSRMRLRLVPTLVSVALIVVVGMALTGGVALAADASAPGDPLHELDLLMERLRLRLTYDSEAATQLRLNNINERMKEFQKLLRKQEQEHLPEAVDEYGEALAALTGSQQGRDALADPARMAAVNQVLAQHEEQLRYAFQSRVGQQDDDGDKDEGNGEEDGEGKQERQGEGWWTDGFTHPVAERLAARYEISSTDVISWFADGYGFGEIMHALETSETISNTEPISCTSSIDDTSPGALLELRASLGGWGQVWQELCLIGGPKHEGPPDAVGQPDEAGPQTHGEPSDQDQDRDRDRDRDRDKDKDQDENQGPPDHAGPNNQESHSGEGGEDNGSQDSGGGEGGEGSGNEGSGGDGGDGNGNGGSSGNGGS